MVPRRQRPSGHINLGGRNARPLHGPRHPQRPPVAAPPAPAPGLPPRIRVFLNQQERASQRIGQRQGGISDALQPFASRATATYGQAADSTQRTGSVLSQGLLGSANTEASGIAAKLAQIQAPGQSTQQFAGGVAQAGAGAAQAMGALTNAEVAQLRGQGTAASIYAAALPNLVRLAGEADQRALAEQGQAQLADLALEESDRQYDRNRQAKLDKIEQQRYARGFRADQRQTAYERRQDALDRREQARRDRLATAAAAREYGLDVGKFNADLANDQAEVAHDAATRAETQRHHRATERAAAQREARMRAQDAKDAKGGSDRADFFTDTRDDAFRRARTYGESLNAARPSQRITKEKARVRLWTEFGPPLRNRGFSSKQINAMLSRALAAAGY